MNQHLLNNVKKSVDQEGIRVKFMGTEDNLADPLNKRFLYHEGMTWAITKTDNLDSTYY